MPELPDVEVFRRYLDRTSLQQPIRKVEVLDSRVLHDLSTRQLQARAKGRRLVSTHRHGKNLFVALDHGGWLAFHFGLSGSLQYFDLNEDRPPYTQVVFAFEGRHALAFIEPRKLGGIGHMHHLQHAIQTHALGPDATELDKASFRQLLTGKRAALKTVLMDQQTLAGIGNVYSDEILFQAGLHPKVKPSDLSQETLDRLFQAMKTTLDQAIRHGAEPARLPRKFLLPQRSKEGSCPTCGQAIQHFKVTGRTAYYCPNCQPPPGRRGRR